MKTLTLDQFNKLLSHTAIKPRLKSELRFVTSTATLELGDWHEREYINITDRTGMKGIMIIEPGDQLYAVPYELTIGLRSHSTGRLSPIICDFCRTWQPGSNAGSISFRNDPRSLDSISFLCCADLACSNHVRNKTRAALVSRTQLREDITQQQRIERLKLRLQQLVDELQLVPIE